MDRSKLKYSVAKFINACEGKGHPISKWCLKEAFPGDISTSYRLEVVADWVDDMDCSKALDILIPIYWDALSEEERKNIFTLEILDSNEDWHCTSEELGVVSSK